MALTLTIQSQAAYTNPQSGTSTVGPISVGGTITPVVGYNGVLASGANTITIPTGAVGCIITPPPTNAQTLKIKGVTGDTGINIPQATPTIFLFDTANTPANFVITAGALTVGNTQVLFF